jgi:Recombination endonuclease VII
VSTAAYDRKYREVNGDKIRRQLREYYHANPRRFRDDKLRRAYGISLADWEKLFASQGHRCAGCGSFDPKSKKGWHTDHDHETGKVRGILCSTCNVALGQVGDSVRVLRELIRYLTIGQK